MVDIDRAVADMDEVMRLKPDDMDALMRRAELNYVAGRFAAAAADFERRLAAHPKDATAAVWLYLAKARNGEDDKAPMEAMAATLEPDKFPGPILSFLLGRQPAAQAIEAMKAGGFSKGNLAQALYFAGQQALIAGDRELAAKYMAVILELDDPSMTEWQAAKAQMARLEQG
jgi:lipoprotein NlpI